MTKMFYIFVSITTVLLSGLLGWVKYQNWKSQFNPPKTEGSTIEYYLGKEARLDGVVENLYYFGFIKDKAALRYALSHTKDSTPGREGTIQVSRNSIDTNAMYQLSQTMSAWQIADTLLNKGKYNDCSHGCPMFMPPLLPGGDLVPPPREAYEWVKTFENCVQAKGQLSSEQYSQRTGEPRKCVSPDGREFIQGVEGWRKAAGG